MSDSQSTNPVRPLEPRDGADRETRIEELLISGLDFYFAGQHERAVNIWSRIIFLDRHHDRARAYIERARSAMAERQRESDELLHEGVTAYNAGDIDKARDLLTRAVQHGSDSADLFLDRLNRAGAASATREPRTDARTTRATVTNPLASAPGRHGWVAAALGGLVLAAVMLLGGLPIGTWLGSPQSDVPTQTSPVVAEEPLPVMRTSDTALARAKELHGRGELREALTALERINVADPLRPEADRLRGAIQRDVLSAAGLSTSSQPEESRP